MRLGQSIASGDIHQASGGAAQTTMMQSPAMRRRYRHRGDRHAVLFLRASSSGPMFATVFFSVNVTLAYHEPAMPSMTRSHAHPTSGSRSHGFPFARWRRITAYANKGAPQPKVPPRRAQAQESFSVTTGYRRRCPRLLFGRIRGLVSRLPRLRTSSSWQEAHRGSWSPRALRRLRGAGGGEADHLCACTRSSVTPSPIGVHGADVLLCGGVTLIRGEAIQFIASRNPSRCPAHCGRCPPKLV